VTISNRVWCARPCRILEIAIDKGVSKPLMVPLVMVVRHVFADCASKMGFTQRYDPVQALALQWIPVEQQVPLPKQKSVERIDEISCHLFHPRTTRVHCDSKDFHFPARNIDGEQHVVANQSEPRHGFYREEVHTDQHAQMGLDERRPRHSLFSLWCRVDAILLENTFDRIAPDLVAQVLQSPHDARVAPSFIPLGHPDDEGRDFGRRLHCCQPFPSQALAQHCQPPSFRIRELQPLRPELLPKQTILRPKVVDLRLQNSLKQDRQPGCQKLQRQRKRQS
jgi:hypothetical protein